MYNHNINTTTSIYINNHIINMDHSNILTVPIEINKLHNIINTYLNPSWTMRIIEGVSLQIQIINKTTNKIILITYYNNDHMIDIINDKRTIINNSDIVNIDNLTISHWMLLNVAYQCMACIKNYYTDGLIPKCVDYFYKASQTINRINNVLVNKLNKGDINVWHIEYNMDADIKYIELIHTPQSKILTKIRISYFNIKCPEVADMFNKINKHTKFDILTMIDLPEYDPNHNNYYIVELITWTGKHTILTRPITIGTTSLTRGIIKTITKRILYAISTQRAISLVSSASYPINIKVC